VVLFALIYNGMIPGDAVALPIPLHAYAMIFAVFSNFFYGFTLTTFPRFSSRPSIETRRYLWLWLLNLLAALSLFASIWLPESFYAASVIMAFSFAYIIKIFYGIYQQASEPRIDQYWIIIAFGMGAISNLLFLLSHIPCQSCDVKVFYLNGVEVGIYLYMIFLAVVIAFRMVPFFSRVMNYQKSTWFHGALFALLLLHLFFAGYMPRALFAVDLAAALLLGYELHKADLPYPNQDPLIWSLHLAMFWLPLGFLVGSITEFFEAWFAYYSFRLPLHLLVLGFLTTILVAFGTRVTLGHGGAVLQVDRWGKSIFYFTQIVVLGRMAFSLTGTNFWFDVSILLWVALILLWLSRYGRILVLGGR